MATFVLTFQMITTGMVIAFLASALSKNKIPRNEAVGFRTKTSLKNDENWQRINSYYGSRALIGAVGLAVFGIVTLGLWAYSHFQLNIFLLLVIIGIELLFVLVPILMTLTRHSFCERQRR